MLRLDGQKVVICRASADAAPLVGLLEGHGAEVISVPLVEPVPPTDGGEALRSEVARLSNYEWLVATSANGSRAVLACFGSVELAAKGFASTQVACVGSATAKVFNDAGIDVVLRASVSSAAGLVAQFPAAQSEGLRVLAAQAVLADDTVAEGLTGRGYEVTRVDAYDTVAPNITAEQRHRIASATAILFTSSSTVDRFVAAVGSQSVPGLAISIGPKTTETMTAFALQPAAVADPHTQQGAVEALLEAVRTMGG